MKIVFQTTCLGVFGSIRELIENANRLVDYGHDVYIYSDLNKYPYQNWLFCKAKLKQLGNRIINCDVLILMDSPFDYQFKLFQKTKAKFKTFVMMGFPLDFKLTKGNELYNYHGKHTEKNLFKILDKYEILADGQWQLDYLSKLGVKTGVTVGGINLDMFYDKNKKRTIDIGWSGDKRPRKASHILWDAIKGMRRIGMNFTEDFYFNKGDQNYLVNFLNNCTFFWDNHLRAGWCNPVLEAMACGAVPICRDHPALNSFAINDETAIVLKNPRGQDFIKAFKNIREDKEKIKRLKENAKKHIKQFSYDVITKNLETYLKSKI